MTVPTKKEKPDPTLLVPGLATIPCTKRLYPGLPMGIDEPISRQKETGLAELPKETK